MQKDSIRGLFPEGFYMALSDYVATPKRTFNKYLLICQAHTQYNTPS